MPYKNLPESEWGKMDRCVEQVMSKQPDLEKPQAIAICYTSITGKEYTPAIEIEPVGAQYRVYDANNGATLKQMDTAREAAEFADAQKATADVNDLPDGAFLYVESGGEKDDTGRTVPRTLRHLPYKTSSGAVDLPRLRNALSRLGQTDTGATAEGKWLTADLRESLRKKAQKILEDNTDAESAQNKEAKPNALDRVMAFIRGEKALFNKQEMGEIGKQSAIDYLKQKGVDNPSQMEIDEAVSELLKIPEHKEGRRNSNTDAGRLQQIHDLAVENGASCPLVLKQANGSYRWILLSTNSYQDRDGEIVSQKAQEADVERMNQSGNFGPLRLWHLGYPDVAAKEAGPGIDIGACDYSQMFGRVRVESGTFTDNRVGAAIKARSDQWAGSIGFFHPIEQPDREGVYQDSLTFERSLLPRPYASNPLTPLAAILKEQEMTTKEDKVKQLGDLLGDAALADTVLKQAEATEKAAQERGLKYKAAEEVPPAAEETPQEEQAEAAALDYEAMAKGLAPFIEKMIKEHMASGMKERADKEASIAAQVTALDATLKETRKIVDVLNSDLPKGVKKFLASQDESTLAADGKYKGMETPQANPMEAVFSWLTQPTAMPPVQATPEK